MKVIETKPEFVPVTLVLETQGEVDLFASFIKNTAVGLADKLFEVDIMKMYIKLDKYTSKDYCTNRAIEFSEGK